MEVKEKLLYLLSIVGKTRKHLPLSKEVSSALKGS